MNHAKHKMWIKFWGVRGSLPCPGASTVRYGGNTACIEMRIEGIDRLIIIDAGTGIRDLGSHLMNKELAEGSLQADIFLTHTHWDHIMGFPFFAPMYHPRSKLRIFGPVTYEEETLQEVLSGQWTYRYFPVRREELTSHVEYIDLKEGEYDLGQGLRLVTKYLNHPLLCLGYRFEYEGKSICTAYDTEPFFNLFSPDPNQSNFDAVLYEEGERATVEENQRLERFVAGADLLIIDAQYTQDEYEHNHIGWGHSSIEYGLDLARRNAVTRLALFHHDMQRSDQQLDEISQAIFSNENNAFDAFFAREGMIVHL